jgi:hypothetical protein
MHRNGDGNGSREAEVVMAGPRRTYSAGDDDRGGGLLARLRGLRGRRLKIAVVTGLLAFVVAVAALTLPELIFGGSVSSSGRTTIFGGGSDSAEDKARDGDRDTDGGGSSQQDGEQTDPTQPRDSSEEAPEEAPAAPEATQPAPRTEPAPPEETQPAPPEGGGGTPVPQVPAPAPPTP